MKEDTFFWPKKDKELVDKDFDKNEVKLKEYSCKIIEDLFNKLKENISNINNNNLLELNEWLQVKLLNERLDIKV